MRLGISSYTYTWAIGVPGHPPDAPLSPQGLLEKARQLGVNVVQVADNMPLDQFGPSGLDSFQNLASQLGIGIEVGTRGIAPDHLLHYLQLARRFHSDILRLVIDTADHQPDPDEVVATLREIIPEFEIAGVRLAIENHDRFTARALADMVERIGSNHIGICLDTVNSFGALEGPEQVLAVLGPLVVNLHVKEFIIFRANHMMGYTIEGRPAGQGQLNVPWLLAKLQDLDLDPNAILELWTPPQESLQATIAREDEWAQISVDYLRSLIPH